MASVGLVYLNNSKTIHMGLAYISAILKQHGHKVVLFDTAFISDKEIIDKIKDSDIQIAMFSVHSIVYKQALELAKGIKCVRPDIFVLFGGWHVCLDPEGVIGNDCVDMVCLGEGEYAALDVANNLKVNNSHRTDVPNIWYKKNGKIIKNPIRPLGCLDELPYPDRDIFDRVCLEDRDGLFHFSTMRGCVYRCDFCCNYKMVDLYKDIGCKYVRFRSIDNIISEMLYLKDRYHPREFFFTDEMFLANHDRVKALCKAYKESNIGIPFGFMARVEHISDELLSVLKDAGCCRIHLGIESGNEELRKKYLNRSMSNREIIDAFTLCHKHGIRTASFNMIGLPFETKDTIRDTFDVNKRCDPGVFQMTILYPFYGTKIRDVYRVNGLLDEVKSEYNMENNYYESYITLNNNLSFSYIKHQQIFMNLFFNYSKLLARVSLFLPLFLACWYDKIIVFLFHLENRRVL